MQDMLYIDSLIMFNMLLEKLSSKEQMYTLSFILSELFQSNYL